MARTTLEHEIMFDTPFEEGFILQGCKQEVLEVISLRENGENIKLHPYAAALA